MASCLLLYIIGGAGDKPVGSETSNVFGDCTVAGNLASFEVTCKKDIQNFQMGFMTTGAKLDLSSAGKKVLIEKTNPKTLKGSASGYPTLEFKVNHTDGSASDITIK